MKSRDIILRGDDIFRMLADYIGKEIPEDAKFGGFMFNSAEKQLAVVYTSLDEKAKNMHVRYDLRKVSNVT